MEWMIGTALIQCPQRDATHLANFDEKVHKPQSKSYGRIGANMQLFLHISYEFEYLYQCITFFGALRDSKGPI